MSSIKIFSGKFGKRDFNAEVRKAVFALEVLAVQANKLYHHSNEESFLSDQQYDDLTIAIAALYRSIGMQRDIKEFGYQFEKPDIHNHVGVDGKCIEEEIYK